MTKKRSAYSLIEAYGGLSAIFRSRYFWTAVLLGSLTVCSFERFDWAPLGAQILPALVGFSIAAFAIMFALMDKPSRDALAIEEEKDKPPPLIALFATISWAIIVQTVTLAYLIILDSAPIPSLLRKDQTDIANDLLTLAGVILLFYSILLVMSVVIYLFDTVGTFAKGINAAHREVGDG